MRFARGVFDGILYAPLIQGFFWFIRSYIRRVPKVDAIV